jgi:hypothetical protein
MPSQPLHLTRPPRLERQAELDVLRALAGSALTGGGRFLIMEGPALGSVRRAW